MNTRTLTALLAIPLGLFFNKTGAQDLTNIKFTVSDEDEWSKLFTRSSGWFGGDGIYSIPLNGAESKTAGKKDKTLFIFSDSMLGEISDGKLQPGSKMIHNSVAILEGKEPVADKIIFSWDMKDGKPESVFHPKTPNTGSTDYYWLGDGFVNQELNNAVYIFGYRVKTVSDGTFGFSEVGNTLIKIAEGQKPPFSNYDQKDTPFYLDKSTGETGSYGAGIYVNTAKAGAPQPDGYLYIYGVKGQAKNLLVARVLPKEFEDYSKWRFFDGTNWQSDMHKAATVTDQVSNELSLTALKDGRYALVFQQNGMGRSVAMRIGASPKGPFGPVIKLFDTSPSLTQKSYFSYNAKAHPSLSKEGELLISYNINSFDFFKDLNVYPQLYRPRFIKVKFQ
ncbi:DUF4185 domain-containing protein [Pedobacter psychroterrae]|uniref:DUF5005 domain-containing protein n=1 Tax=Pedobacter psychroterrae TaxID=2530453 RepID=A0A4R0NHH4_9SPHI|nr:DUF4185 domain-containing protein [Pedobacter psychroterrae]TCD00060.1 DUF5005 domain-containing protein [Pedobacter psychroterrae]